MEISQQTNESTGLQYNLQTSILDIISKFYRPYIPIISFQSCILLLFAGYSRGMKFNAFINIYIDMDLLLCLAYYMALYSMNFNSYVIHRL